MIDEVKKVLLAGDELLKAMENSIRSYDEILAFITSEDASKDEEK